MGDMREVFDMMKEYQKEKKAEYQKTYMHSDIERFEKVFKVTAIHNGGHMVGQVTTDRGERIVDYWPETGTWMVRKSSARGKGVPNLFRYLRIDEVKP